ncbi:MAG: Bro-N domain-containing protein [Clostridia bacterium]
MNDLQVFENAEFGEVRTVAIDNEPWFVAADVCRALEIKNSADAIRRLDDDEKMTIDSTEGHSGQRGGAQNYNIVNEPGLYTLVLGSRKPEAKAFKRWITHDVIPSIRKHGAYAIPGVKFKEMDAEAKLNNSRARLSAMWMKISQQVNIPEYKQICASCASRVLTGGEAVIPLPEKTERYYSATELGQIYGVSANKIGKLANANGLKTAEYGKEVWSKSEHSCKQVAQFLYNELGRARIEEILGKEKRANA